MTPVVPRPINPNDYFYNQDSYPTIGVRIRRVYKYLDEIKRPELISKFTYKLKSNDL
jgi:hypothetical protein